VVAVPSAHTVRAWLLAFWATRMGKVALATLVLAPWVQLPLLLPAIYYTARAARRIGRRLLYSVRAKLAAFYICTALLPLVLFACTLLFIGRVFLGQASSRTVEERLRQHVVWADQRARLAENSYWRARVAGANAASAARVALDAGYGDLDLPGLACWVQTTDGRTLASRGDLATARVVPPEWLGDRRFVGLVANDSLGLEVRARVHLAAPRDTLEFGSCLPIDQAILNARLPARAGEARSEPDVAKQGLEARAVTPDSLVASDGVLAILELSDQATVRAPGVRLDFNAADSVAAVPSGQTPPRSTAVLPGIRSRYAPKSWVYLAYPLDWSRGVPSKRQQGMTVLFSVEGGIRALLASAGDLGRFALFMPVVAMILLLLFNVLATLFGLTYARVISTSVARLDRGVRAVRSGDFDHRIVPPQRDQLGTLSLAFNDMSARLSGLLEESVARQAMERELAIARDVQARLFPARMPQASFFDAWGVCAPAKTVSGDYFDFIEIPGGYDAVIADVSGKGISAALLMASLHASLHSLYVREGRDAILEPSAVVALLNRQLHKVVEPSRFVTLFLARYCGDGRLVYCNAGHNPGALVRDRRVEWLGSGGTILGPFPNPGYSTSAVPVRAGDLVCLYTDGVTEATAPSGEQFGEDRLGRILCDAGAEPPRDIVALVQQEVARWRGDDEATDDITLVLMRITA